METGSLLPPPCSECEPYGGDWTLTEKGMRRCSCDRGRALKAASLPAAAYPPILREAAVVNALQALDGMNFFPKNKAGRTLVGNEIRAMVGRPGGSYEDACEMLRWLVTRMCQLYPQKWPGIADLRMVYAQKYGTCLDAVRPTGASKVYPRGIPSERVVPAPTRIALPPGHAASCDPASEIAVGRLAEVKQMPSGPRTLGLKRKESDVA